MSSEYIEIEELTKLGELMISKMKWKVIPKVKFLLLEKETSTYLGKCSKATGKWRYLIDYDYIIEIWGAFFDTASDEEKEALIFHELNHITWKDKNGIIIWKIQKHDLEEFFCVVQEYKLWNSSLKSFVKCIGNNE